MVTVLHEYLRKTVNVRTSSKLFVSFVKPYGPVCKDTIARWIKTVMKNSGINTSVFKAHSVRSTSTSKAASKDIPIGTIMNTAGWTQQSTFAKFYNKPVAHDNDYAKAVLSHI